MVLSVIWCLPEKSGDLGERVGAINIVSVDNREWFVDDFPAAINSMTGTPGFYPSRIMRESRRQVLEALEYAIVPMREFMLAQMGRDDLKTFMAIANRPAPDEFSEISTWTIIPAFVLSEIKRAFMIGFFLYVPFLIIDLVVASTLMSLGMMMLPPGMVSMPFKLMIFLLFDGWGLIIRSLMAGFN